MKGSLFLATMLVGILALASQAFPLAYDCNRGCGSLCAGDMACLWRCYTCCPPEEITREVDCSLCGGHWEGSRCLADLEGPVCSASNLSACADEEACLSAGGHWCEGACQAEPCEESGQETGSEEGLGEPVPQEQVIGLADPASAPVKIVSLAGALVFTANFNYQGPVDILAGLLSCDFQKIYWLDPATCNLGTKISWLARQKRLNCPPSPLPEGNGYLFWLVSPVEIGNLDFRNGAYLLQFILVGSCF